MQQVLTKIGFSFTILSAILALYATPSARAYSSSFLFKSFPISNRTRQGCPLSLSIFNQMIEPLAETIRSHPEISVFHSHSHVINFFASDVILMLTNPSTLFPHAHHILSIFSAISYYKGHSSKSFFLDLEIPRGIWSNLSSNFPYFWSDKGIP